MAAEVEADTSFYRSYVALKGRSSAKRDDRSVICGTYFHNFSHFFGVLGEGYCVRRESGVIGFIYAMCLEYCSGSGKAIFAQQLA